MGYVQSGNNYGGSTDAPIIFLLMGVLCLLMVSAAADDVPVLQALNTGNVQNGAGIPGTRSDADGRFALMCPHPQRATPWSPSPAMLFGFVVTRHPDYGITVTPWQRTDAG